MNRPGAVETGRLMDSYMMLFDMSRFPNLESLTVNLLKKTYRKKIFQNHPDRAVVLGVDRSILDERSKEITFAYDMLLRYVEAKRRPARRHAGRGNVRTGAKKGGPRVKKTIDEALFSSMNKYQMPPATISLIHYLYYLDVIDFKTVVEALTWQKNERPYLGKLAREMKFLNDSDTALIVKNRRKKELFGSCAIRLGLLRSDQVSLLMVEQDARTPRIETYLLRHAILNERELAFVMAKLDEHNMRASARKSA